MPRNNFYIFEREAVLAWAENLARPQPTPWANDRDLDAIEAKNLKFVEAFEASLEGAADDQEMIEGFLAGDHFRDGRAAFLAFERVRKHRSKLAK